MHVITTETYLDQACLVVLVNVGELFLRFSVCIRPSVPKMHWRGEGGKTA